MTTDVHETASTGLNGDRRSRIDSDLAVLVQHKDQWARLPIAARIEHLATLARRTDAQAQRWVRAACRAKGIDPELSAGRRGVELRAVGPPVRHQPPHRDH